MKKSYTIRWQLLVYDWIVLVACYLLLLQGGNFWPQLAVGSVCMVTVRLLGSIYSQVWRYGGVACYIRLIIADFFTFLLAYTSQKVLLNTSVEITMMIAIFSLNLIGALMMRLMYRFAFKNSSDQTFLGKVLMWALKVFAGESVDDVNNNESQKINIAIIGAGRVGVSLAEDLLNNKMASYRPCCFVDVSREKAGKSIHGLPVFSETNAVLDQLKRLEIQEVVFAIQSIGEVRKKYLYEKYASAGYKIKLYDFPVMQTAGKRQLRTFDVEDLLFRKPIEVEDEQTKQYYRGKTVLITGGGGSIGSELCRQLAKMGPKQLIILDVYENGAYDVQQELKMNYGTKLDVRVEILSVTDKKALRRVFETYHPQILIHAAAHKHVPLMEHNCVEAVQNNVFGTKNVIDLCEEYEAERFMMVSTDKAVNPTNVMGATKRMCEMMVQSASTSGKVRYSATRFGNVLGSAGSVIPLFRRQIVKGGPITITDKRIIRYFMTIPEASQLVLASGAMAKNGELFVLDMGQPVRIMDLAENMIKLSGATDIEIIETGLRPGEKLYEELLVKTEDLDKTENSLIFIERDVPLEPKVIDEKLKCLQEACDLGNDDAVRCALREAVPTFKKPEEINQCALDSEEMKKQRPLIVKRI